MSNQVTVTRTFVDEVYTVTIEVVAGGTLPLNIFLYTYEGQPPADFYAVCTLENLTRPVYEVGLSEFGVRYVRYDKAIKEFTDVESASAFEAEVIARINSLNTELEGSTTYTKTYTIGV